jgi:dihydrofolate reductase
MRKIILSMMTSLDGKIARSDGDIEWFLTDERLEETLRSLLHQVDAMIFGRVSYQLLADFWPTAGTATAAEDPPGGFTSPERAAEFAHLMNTIPKIVVSHAPAALPWGPARSIDGDLPDAIHELKAEPGGDLVLFAGADLATSFIDLGLIDDYRLFVHPTVLGKGIALFDRIHTEQQLHLLDVSAFPSGVVQMRYEPESRHARSLAHEWR